MMAHNMVFGHHVCARLALVCSTYKAGLQLHRIGALGKPHGES